MTKSHLNDDADGSGDSSVGDTLTYTYVVTNDGAANLTGVSVSDLNFGAGALGAIACVPAQPATLAPAQVMTCPYAFVKVSKDVTFAHFEKDRHYSYPQPKKLGKAEPGRVSILPTHTLHERIGKAEGRVRAYGALLDSRGL